MAGPKDWVKKADTAGGGPPSAASKVDDNKTDPTLWEHDVFKAVDDAVASSESPGTPSLTPISPIPFGKYALVAQLGMSGLSHLLLAVAKGDGGFRKLVVVKRLRPIFVSEPDRVTDFFAEARLGARVQHPNIVQTLESGTHSGQPFTVMEHLEGQTFDRLLRRRSHGGKRLPMSLLGFVAQQILSGLSYVHRLDDFDGKPLNLVLRDVSPGNVLVTYGGEVKLLNFGISNPVAGSTETSPSWQQGKFSYYAPEQVEGIADRRTDLFAVGVVLWEGLMGKPLFSADSPAETLLRVQRGEIPKITLQDVPPALVSVVERALSRRPDDRFQDAASFRAALSEVAHQERWLFGRDDLADLMEDDFADVRDRYGVALRQCVCDGMAELARSSSPPGSTSSHSDSPPGRSSSQRPSGRPSQRAAPKRRDSGPPKRVSLDSRWLIAVGAVGIPLWLIAIALIFQMLK